MTVKQNVDLRIKCLNKPKLRTFNTFKDFGTTPPYLLLPISFVQKKFIAKTRLSAPPIRIETGRFERPKLLVHQRLCPCCKKFRCTFLLHSIQGHMQHFTKRFRDKVSCSLLVAFLKNSAIWFVVNTQFCTNVKIRSLSH